MEDVAGHPSMTQMRKKIFLLSLIAEMWFQTKQISFVIFINV